MRYTKDTIKPSIAFNLAPASVINSEGLENLKRRAEKLGLIIHEQSQKPKTATVNAKPAQRRIKEA